MIRWAEPDRDASALAEVFFRSVRMGESPYTEAERAAWMPQAHPADAFSARLAQLDAAVFERDGRPVGFMSVEPGGYIDLAFILPDCRGEGIFRALYERIEERAKLMKETRLWTHASLMAQPAFKAVGFWVIEHQIVPRDGQQLRRAKMEKLL